jgi:intracellular sulfur oxidation DsrE/DsrF family protein
MDVMTNRKIRNSIMILLPLWFLLLGGSALASGIEEVNTPPDAAALRELSTGKAVFDIRIGDPQQLLFALKVIDETAAGLRRQKVVPDFVLTFRGATLPLLKRSVPAGKTAEQAVLAEIHERLGEFHQQQMPLEACNVAARAFKVEAADLDPSLKLIGNSIISLIGYQQQGYALVPMY